VTVLFLISSEGHYGMENMLLTLARGLSELGVKCVIGVLRDSRFPHVEVGDQARQMGLAVEIIPCHGRWSWTAVRHIRELLLKHNVDVLHPHGYKADCYAYAAAWPNQVALLATSHNWPSRLPRMRFYAAIDKLVLGRFDKVVVVSDVVGKILRRWGVSSKNLSMIFNGVDIERFRTASPTLRNEFAPEGHSIVGFVGRLVGDKGGDLLLQAVPRVLHEFPKTTFVLVGDGPSRPEWEKLAERLGIAKNVVFAGVREDMPEVYASLDMLVLPSLIESMPMCLLEAMAAGRPVIGTRVGAVPKVIHSEQTGVLVNPGNLDELTNAICQLLGRSSFAADLGKNGQAYVTQHFSAISMAKSYMQAYAQLLANRRSDFQAKFRGGLANSE
jgi:glycosyltransferase involved in cell wall biosynthesis